MTTLEAIFLGILQGVTEFLPISSSGHLILAQYFLGFQKLENYVFFDLICHLGTLCAILCVMFRRIMIVLKNDWKQVALVIAGTLPLFPLVLLMKPIKALFNEPQYLGYCFLFTACLLFLGSHKTQKMDNPSSSPSSSWWDAFFIGLFQAIAILPGISRSGSTISAARMRGWDYTQAIQFSFFLAIPAILGAIAWEVISDLRHGETLSDVRVSSWNYLLGFSVSFVVGYFALQFVMKLASKDKFRYFGWYCLSIGLLTLGYTNFIDVF